MSADTHWNFASGFDPSRRSKLETSPSFPSLCEHISTASRIAGTRICEGKRFGYAGCYRPEFDLECSIDLVDMLFNGPRGYRAQFLADPNLGQSENNRLIACLAARLIDEVEPTDSMSAERIRDSLAAVSAKLWVHEGFIDPKYVSTDLDIRTWAEARDSGHDLARLGLWAPQTTMLQVIGAFIDRNGNEVVPFNKINRRFHIHEWGWS